MARINIEDDLETKYEFWKLAKITGDRDLAMGKLVRFFRLAQKRFGENRTVSGSDLSENELESMIESGWAVRCEDGEYRCKGEKEHFAWYRQKIDAGKNGGRPKRAAPEIEPVETGDNRTVSDSNPPTPTPTLAPTPTLTQILKEELKESAVALSVVASPVLQKIDKRKSTTDESKAISRVIAAYVPAWQSRHNTRARPNVGGVQQGILRRLIRDHPLDYLCELIQVYCQMQHKYFDDRKHDLATFERGFNEIALAHDKGDESSINWSKVFGEADGSDGFSSPGKEIGGDIQQARLSDGTS